MSDLHKLTGAYAVDALDELERARFERHLAECEDCRTEVAELQETAALLSQSTAVAPPASLRDSVLAGISQVRPLPPVVPEPVATTPSTARHRFPLLVAAALVLIAGFGAVVWQPWSTPAPQISAAEQVLTAGDAQHVSVKIGDSKATVTRSKERDGAVIVTENMQAAPSGKDYELWLMAPDGTFSPAGLMSDDADQTQLLEGSAADAAAVGITIEPDGGSEQPTSDPIALFDLESA
ncbi:Anti-sigma-K factor RskA [Nocardioides exalbidus]|uniref:Regulator of SigK n=1 Tax=Nocardioides exalbidus TaxID=402596 RepID=A0A1H4MVN4_9ACTN|nr:anti-sigma factor [Nocardioides exalbidus]SEB86887.1 Anti-sigma-K factor RskA [Nocardioides exalbidus]